jgi:hypothetical protein
VPIYARPEIQATRVGDRMMNSGEPARHRPVGRWRSGASRFCVRAELDSADPAYDIGIVRAILTALLLVTAGSAWADWVKVAETGDTVFYVEPASIDDKGDFRRASVVQDYAAPSPEASARQVPTTAPAAAEKFSATDIRSRWPMAQVNRELDWSGCSREN